jgi:hypothetical protein
VRSLPRVCASRLPPLHTNCRELRRVGPAVAPSLLPAPLPPCLHRMTWVNQEPKLW